MPDEWLEHGLPPKTDPRRFTFVIVCNHCKARKTTLQEMRQHFEICPNKTSHPDLTCGHCRYTTQSWASKPTWDAFGKAVSSSAPAPAEGGGGQGSCGSLLTVVSLGATGDRLDPVSPHQEGHELHAGHGITATPPGCNKQTSLRQWHPRWHAASRRCCRRASDVIRRPAPVDAAAACDVAKPYTIEETVRSLLHSKALFSDKCSHESIAD